MLENPRLKAKQALSPETRARLRGLNPLGNYPYDGKPVRSPAGVSDFFVWRGGDYETRFVAENTPAILSGRPLPCTHRLVFVNGEGQVLSEQTVESCAFNASILPRPDTDEQSTGFFHQAIAGRDAGEGANEGAGLVLQHRGYTGYRRRQEAGAGSAGGRPWMMVHGNFGSLYRTADGALASHAVPRGRFSYRSQIIYREGMDYELFFLSPMKNPLTIEIKELSKTAEELVYTLTIPPFGHRLTKYRGTGRQLGWSSPLPICRPIIFEHDRETGSFDVFHG